MTRTDAHTETSYFVILSGRYCTPEISAEFGKLPPSFIPVGSRRLYARQLELARRCNAVPILSLPADYVLSPWDTEILESEGVRVVRSPQSLSINEAVQFVLEVIDAKGSLYLLYGDTLVEGDGLDNLDQIAVHNTQSHYHWAVADTAADGKLTISSGYGDGTSNRSVVCGFFSFSDATALRHACVSARSFDNSIETYARKKGMRAADVSEWHDFGHLSLVYQSRRNVMVSRSFNRIWSDGVSLVKSSSNRDKIAAEANWYATIPETLRIFTPQYLGHDAEHGRYRLEYLYLPTLAELFTFGDLPGFAWRQILESCTDFLRECRRHKPDPDSEITGAEFSERFFDNMFRQKTRKRIKAFLESRGWDEEKRISLGGQILPPLGFVCEKLLDYIRPTKPEDITVWHGDFFFGNVLYDFRAARVRVIDPRGGDAENSFSVYGDRRYDVSKLAHSIVGGYDSLLSNCVDFENLGDGDYRFNRRQSKAQLKIERVFRSLELDGDKLYNSEIAAMTALLFLTMLPLHADDPRRQDILLCNGLTLAQDLFQGKV